MRKRLGITLAAVLIFAVAIILTLVLTHKPELVRYKASFFDVFDTYSEIIVYVRDEQSAQATLDTAHEALRTYHQLFDIYQDYEGINNIKTINDQAGIAPVAVDTRIIDMLLYALDMQAKTDGRMNVAMGSVLKLWHDHRTQGIDDPLNATLPDMAALTAAAAHTDIRQVIIDQAAGTVYLSDPAMALDVGAVAKGYAVEQVAQAMIARSVSHAILSIGGNVRSIGTRGDGTSWRVNVQNPDLSAENTGLMTLNLNDLSLVTSGSYQRYYTVAGKQYHHIIDPDTLLPAAHTWAVSIVTEDSGLADVLSTALYTLPLSQGLALLAQFPGAEAVWVTLNGDIVRSPGFSALAGEEAAP